ncbi:hypothetical protein BKA67DRAFT_530861 [Truncatella angustata]|uniref:Uncharacterized protein n=1 Tax=Truncatella angustata TaxID=152316 RepID=A0A9P8UYM2_9PEZI|nr:uncharacterized protein BKA67DRAFT_530861 [Truncatella angustata]KAH6660775.1 hypothetical protein BKA67DRAFT_530861 [Truncatella angustata]KAH8203018.1 hypothetical protein TruAng_002852 [Truncatella angustata]
MTSCKKGDLRLEAQRLEKWTYDQFAEYQHQHLRNDGYEYDLSTKAKNYIQRWIDIDTASCHFQGVDEDFWKVSLTVYEKMRSVPETKRVAFFCRENDFVEKNTSMDDRAVTGKEIGTLALMYSLIVQMIDLLPGSDNAQFEASLLAHLKRIDGSKCTCQDGLDAITHLLALLGNDMVIIIDHVDALETDNSAREANAIWTTLKAKLGAHFFKTRTWYSYYRQGASCYQDVGYSKKEQFSVGPGILHRKHSLKELDFEMPKIPRQQQFPL